ncbi:MAG TPA: RNA polymerase sigma factor RpoH [Gammaproteobacteria bacterium]|nr:RNA polymerase sigma factor RpoH [Gammaproteobacteria bacterium]
MTNTLNLPLPTGSLESYISAVQRIPMLSEEDERELARRYRDSQDLDAARELVMAHLRFVVRVARGYLGYGLPHGDLIQEGNIGLMKAVKRFDPAVGVRLVSFAVHWIRAEIHEYILRNWRIVKVATTKAQRKLFFNLRSAKQRLGWMNAQEVDAVAQDLGVDAKTVLLMEERMNAHDQAFDVSIEDGDEDLAPASYLADTRFEPSEQLEAYEEATGGAEQLAHALATLDERSRDIIASRWLTEPKQTLHELAGKYKVSAERIRQIENNAFNTLKRALTPQQLALLPAKS